MRNQDPPCERCECRAESHERSHEDAERGACAECDCARYVGPGVACDEPREPEPYDGLCEYERRQNG